MICKNTLRLAVSLSLISLSWSNSQPQSPMMGYGNTGMSPVMQVPYGSPMMNQGMNPMINQGVNPMMNQGMMNQGMMNQGMMQDPNLADPMMGLNQGMNSGMMNQDASMGGGQFQPDAPGTINPLSIQALVHGANASVAPEQMGALSQGVQFFTDGNLADARRVFTDLTQRFPEGVATDRAYLGIAKVERAYGAYDVSRRVLESVIKKNRDYESIQLARRAYADLEQEVMRSVSSSQQIAEGSYARYKEISWFNIFSKIKAYNQYKDAKANYEGLLVSASQFDPVYKQLNITTPNPVLPPSASEQKPVSVPADIQSQIDSALALKNANQPSLYEKPQVQITTDNYYVPAQAAVPAPAPQAQPQAAPSVPTPAPAVVEQKPLVVLSADEARAAYLAAYEKLKEALKGDNAELKRTTQAEYQHALQQYNLMKVQ